MIYKISCAVIMYSARCTLHVNNLWFGRSEHIGRNWQVSWRGRRRSTDTVWCILRRETQRRGRACHHYRLSGSQQSLWTVHRHLWPGPLTGGGGLLTRRFSGYYLNDVKIISWLFSTSGPSDSFTTLATLKILIDWPTDWLTDWKNHCKRERLWNGLFLFL